MLGNLSDAVTVNQCVHCSLRRAYHTSSSRHRRESLPPKTFPRHSAGTRCARARVVADLARVHISAVWRPAVSRGPLQLSQYKQIKVLIMILYSSIVNKSEQFNGYIMDTKIMYSRACVGLPYCFCEYIHTETIRTENVSLSIRGVPPQVLLLFFVISLQHAIRIICTCRISSESMER